MNNQSKDSSSINSEDSNEHNQTRTNDAAHSSHISSPTPKLSASNLLDVPLPSTALPAPSGTSRSISSVTTGSLSFDLLDQLKPAGGVGGGTVAAGTGSDVDSEGYSIRPADASSLDLRSQNFNMNSRAANRQNKDNDDMNNFYNSSSTTSNSDDSDSDAADSVGPVKVMLKIKPMSEVAEDAEKQKNNTDVLREISKCLQLKAPGQVAASSAVNVATLGRSGKSRAYYYNYGTSAGSASTSTSTTPTPTGSEQTTLATVSAPPVSTHITRSISAGSVIAPSNTHSLLDLDFSKPAPPTTLSLAKSSVGEQSVNSNLYNIDEDKEVESSFNPSAAYQVRKSSVLSTGSAQSPATAANAPAATTAVAPGGVGMTNGRFTPACFPGRTTPDFRHTTSLFEQQGTRASIISPLTINGGSEIIPIAIAFNETIHAYFKIGDASKFKVRLLFKLCKKKIVCI